MSHLSQVQYKCRLSGASDIKDIICHRTNNQTLALRYYLHFDPLSSLYFQSLRVFSVSHEQCTPPHTAVGELLVAGRSICWRDFKTIWNLIYHLDALFTERLCTPGKRANGSLRVWPPGGKRESVDKATGAHYLVVYACPRSAIDGCQRTVWSRQMWLDPTFPTKDDQAAITRPWKWHVGAVILDYLSASLLRGRVCLWHVSNQTR